MIFMFLRGFQSAANPTNKPADAKAALVEVLTVRIPKTVNILVMGTDGRIGSNSAETFVTDTIMVLNVSGSDKDPS